MKLRKPCEHGRYDQHDYWGAESCPGGVFLPDDTLIIEKVDGEWSEATITTIASAFDNSDRISRQMALAVLRRLSEST